MSHSARGAYAPPRDRMAGYGPADDEDDHEHEHGRGALLLGVAAAVLVAFAAVVWSAYHQGVRERSAPPLIMAEEVEYRVVPENPGGAASRHTEIDVYESGRGARANDDVREDYAALAPETDADDPAADFDAPPGALIVTPDGTLRAGPSTLAERDEDDGDAVEIADAAPVDAGETLEGILEDGAPVFRMAPPSPGLGGREPGDSDEEPAGEDYVIQLASHRSREAALAEWGVLQEDLSDLLSGREADILEVDLGDRGGVWHRLRLTGFADRARANAFCDLLQARGQNCLTVRD